MQKKNHRKLSKIIIIICDVLALAAPFVLKWLSSVMLSIDSTCIWTIYGAKCITCGGTHFVKSLFSGEIAEAFQHNQFLFIAVIYIFISYIILNIYVLFELKIAKDILMAMYNIPMLIIWISIAFIFLIVRNTPLWIGLYMMISEKL